MKKLIISCLLLSLTGGFFGSLPGQADGPQVLISEVCTDPQSDWSTNEFAGSVGKGPITSSDEFIEIVNVSEQNIDLTGWTIKIEDSAIDLDQIDSSLVKNGEDITQFQPDHYFVLGNPIGSMNNDVRLELFDQEANLVDSVSLGDFDDGDLDDNAPNGNAATSEDEVVARNYNNQDTDDDANDFRKNSQTIGRINLEWEEEEIEEEEDEEEENQESPAIIEYSDQVIITEILPNPEGSDSEGEFIELYNEGSQTVDLTGWLLGDSSSRIYTIDPEDLPSTKIKTEQYFAVYREASGIALNNSGDQVVLYHPDQQVVDELEYITSYEGQAYAEIEGQWKWTSTPTPGQANDFEIQNEPPEAKIEIETKEIKVGQTIKLSAAGSADPDGDDLVFVWDLGDGQAMEGEEIEYSYQNEGELKIILTVTDSQQATDQAEALITVTDYDYSDKILINELLPNPEENDKANEWIELINTGAEPVDLEGWQLTDERTDYIFPEGSVIKPQELLVIWRDESKIGLNNSGDKLLLKDPTGQVINGVEYQTAKAGLAFARVNERDWCWTDIPSEGKANEFSLSEDEEDNDESESNSEEIFQGPLAAVNQLESGDQVLVEGSVSVEPGILGKNIYYLMDETGGVQIYCSGECPTVELTDQLRLEGKISVSQGNNRIKVTSEQVEIIGQQAAEAITLTAAELTNWPNSLVQLSGRVISVEQSSIYLEDELGETAKIYLKRSTGLKNSLFEEDQAITITGIVEPTKEEIRLLPRYPEDVVINGQVLGETITQPALEQTERQLELTQTKTEANNNLVVYLVIGLVALGAGGYYWWQRRKNEE